MISSQFQQISLITGYVLGVSPIGANGGSPYGGSPNGISPNGGSPIGVSPNGGGPIPTFAKKIHTTIKSSLKKNL